MQLHRPAELKLKRWQKWKNDIFIFISEVFMVYNSISPLLLWSGIFYLLDFYKKGGKIMDTESSGMQLKKQNSFIIDIFSICNIFSRELLATYRSGSFVITQ